MAGLELTGFVIRLFGNLGAGKTEFVRGFTAALDSSAQVRSPSFTLVNAYPTDPPVYHADLYRIHDEDEYEDLDLESEAADGVLIVEWAERAGSLLDEADIDITISFLDDSNRRIRLKSSNPDNERRLRQYLTAGASTRGVP